MNMRLLTAETIHTLRRQIPDPVSRLFLRFGDRGAAYGRYHDLLDWIIEPYIHTVEVGGVTADFEVTTGTEFMLVRTAETKKLTERPVIEDLLEELRPDDTFYDIGANIGLFSLLAARKLPEGTVLAIEPLPQNIERIRTNLDLNDIDCDLEIIESVISDTIGPVGFRIEGKGHAGVVGSDIRDDGEMTVPSTTVGQLVADGHPAPDVMKIDAEGAELQILESLDEDVLPRALYVEVHPQKIDDGLERVTSLLEDYGYTVETVHKRVDMPFLKAQR